MAYGAAEPPPMRKPQQDPRKRALNHQRLVEMTLMVIVPWLIFISLASLVAFGSYSFRPFVWVMSGSAVLASLVIILGGLVKHRGLYFSVGFFCLASTFMACGVGIYVDSEIMDEYFTVGEGATYQQISPDQDGATVADATIISFVEGSFVDSSNAIGYMEDGIVYCAAPIATKSSALSSNSSSDLRTVHFWAIGQDCCEARSQFSCDDADKPSARSGIVLLEKDDAYNSTFRMQSAANQLVPGEEAKYLRWVADAESYSDDLLLNAVVVLALAACTHFVMFVALSVAIIKSLPKGGVPV